MRLAVRDRDDVADVALALGLGAASLLAVATGAHAGAGAGGPFRAADEISLLLVAALALPLVLRRRHPIVVLAVVGAARGCALLIREPPLPASVAVLIALYGAVLYARTTARVLAGVLVAAGIGLWEWLIIERYGLGSGQALFRICVGLLVLVGGLAHRALKARAARVETERRALERAHREAVRSLAEEQARIAHELHDVLTHGVTTMVVQADAARLRGAGEDRAAATALTAIATIGRRSLVELRQLLAVLDPVPAPPQDVDREEPGVPGLDRLLGRVRDAGVDVGLAVEGAPRRLPPDVQVTAFRIVQEALTNAMRHGSDRSVQVAVRYGEAGVEIEVANRCPGTGRSGDRLGLGDGVGDGPGVGLGLEGMRRRAERAGGELLAGRDQGRFRVLARLPQSVPE